MCDGDESDSSGEDFEIVTYEFTRNEVESLSLDLGSIPRGISACSSSTRARTRSSSTGMTRTRTGSRRTRSVSPPSNFLALRLQTSPCLCRTKDMRDSSPQGYSKDRNIAQSLWPTRGITMISTPAGNLYQIKNLPPLGHPATVIRAFAP